MRRSGNGSSVANVSRWNAVTGPISTKFVVRAVTPGRRRVTAHAACEWWRCAGWAIRRPYCSQACRNASRNPRGSVDVVVEHEQPVEAPRSRPASSAVEVLELAAAAGLASHELDLVARLRAARSRAAVSSERRRGARRRARARAPRARRAAPSGAAAAPGARPRAARPRARRAPRAISARAPSTLPLAPDRKSSPPRAARRRRAQRRLDPARACARSSPGPSRAAGAPRASAARERAQLARERGRRAAALVGPAARAAAAAGGAAERAQARVLARPAVVDGGRGEVADPAAVLEPARAATRPRRR